MAIGWMYREDYARAGIRLTPNLPNTQYAAQSTVIQALFYAVLMIPVSLWPAALHTTGYLYAITASILGAGYLWYTIRFARILRDPTSEASLLAARNLLRASILYLPLLLAAMMLDAEGRLLF
jgi:protoheme IX farnesyltransferase